MPQKITVFSPGWMSLLLLVGLSPAVAAHAQSPTDEPSYPQLTGTVALVSDYRFRGVSYSNLQPAIQSSLQLTTEAGFFVGAWASSIAEFNGATVEVDIYGGWSGSVGLLTASLGVTGYLYPGGTGTDTVELYSTLGATLGPASLTLGLNWSPDQKNLGRSSRYVYAGASASIPGTPISLQGNLGNERGGLVFDESGQTTSKWDWQIGASVSFSAVTLGVAYVGNDLPRNSLVSEDGGSFRANRTARDGVVATVSASF